MTRSGQIPSVRGPGIARALTHEERLHAQLPRCPEPVGPVAIVRTRDEQRSRTRAAFVHALDFLVRLGWSLRELSRYMQCDVRTLSDMRDGKRPVYDWALGALPIEGREAFRAAFGAELRTGTEG